MSVMLPLPQWKKRNDGKTFALSLALSVAVNAAVLTLPAWMAGEPEEHVFLLVTTGEYAVEEAIGAPVESSASIGRPPSPPEEQRFAEEEEPPEREPEQKPDRAAARMRSPDTLGLPENSLSSPFAGADAREREEERERTRPLPKRPAGQPPGRASPAPPAEASPASAELREGAAPGTRGIRRRARQSEGFDLVYPYESRLRGESGTVLIAAAIAADGSCLSARIERGSGSLRLDSAALDAVLRGRFEPATLNGRPVGSEERFEIAFELEEAE